MGWKEQLLILTITAITTLPIAESVVVCYYESWATYRQGDGKVEISDLDPMICTHYIYAFAGVDNDYSIEVLDPWGDLCDNWGKCGYDKFTAMKNKNPNLKTLLSVGGWNEGSAIFSQMVGDASNRARFISTATVLLQKHNFDGLDISWSYPTQNGGRPEDKENFVTFLSELKTALSEKGMLVTISVAPIGNSVLGYDVLGIAPHIDFASITTYNFHGPWEHYTHHHAGLYPVPNDTDDNLRLNVDGAITYWVDSGMPNKKIVVGVAAFGRCWSLDNAEEHGYYAPAYVAGMEGPWTKEPGLMAYGEICKLQSEQGWVIAQEEGASEPYTYHMSSNRLWCSYDDHSSVAIKAKYAHDYGLGGVMVWSINDDDAHGVCGDRSFELTKTIADTFNNY